MLNLHGSTTRLPFDLVSVKRHLTELEAMFGEQIRRITDVPYPFGGSVVPPLWSWKALQAIFVGKLKTMTRWCNKKFLTETSVRNHLIGTC